MATKKTKGSARKSAKLAKKAKAAAGASSASAKKSKAAKGKAKEKKVRKGAKAGPPPWMDGDGPGPVGETELLVDVLKATDKLKAKVYERELEHLQLELVKLQEWIKNQGLKVVVVFEGRDAAGKGGVITRITQRLNPRVCRVVALPAPTERERTQWYFQRYVAHLPAAGEMVLLDRSWYNRAGVEHVMGFCTDNEYREFLRSCPEFERMLLRSGIILIKYWFSVSDEVQEVRFQERLKNPIKRWKLSPMDLQSRERWVEYSKAKDMMFAYTDIKQAPWFVVQADDKKRARINCIAHLLSMIPYEDLTPEAMDLPPRQRDTGYVRPPMNSQRFVPDALAKD